MPANEFLNLEGRKLSTSRDWAVWVHEALDAFPPDLLRYALASTLPEQRDADFSWGEFQSRVNSELADVLGNFVNRTLTFAHRFADGRVPALDDPSGFDRDVLEKLGDFPARIGGAYEGFRLREAVQETMGLARLGNKYFNDTEPWHTRDSDPRAMRNTLHVCLQLCASLSILMDPVLPFSAARLRQMIALRGVRPSAPGGEPGTVGWEAAATPLLTAGHALGEPEILFEKIEDEAIQQQRDLLDQRANQAERPAGPPFEPAKEIIAFDDFVKLDLRIGEVVAAEPHPNADRLLRLEIDLGYERRQILAGIADQYEPEEILGRRVAIVANLKPRTIRGLESQGMVLMAEDREGRFVPITADSEPGSVVR